MNIRRINKGIALGCVLAIGTACYVVYDQKQFSKGHDKIESTVEQYLKDVASAQVGKNAQDVVDSYRDIVDRYWVSSDWFKNDNNYSVMDKSGVVSDWDTIVKDLQPTGYYEKCDVRVEDIDISKYGNKGAFATVSFNTACEFYGAPLDILNGYITITENENYTPMGESETDPSIKYKSNREYSGAEFYLENVDGDWRITGTSYFGYSSNTNIVSDDNSSVDDGKTYSSAADSDKKAGEQNG